MGQVLGKRGLRLFWSVEATWLRLRHGWAISVQTACDGTGERIMLAPTARVRSTELRSGRSGRRGVPNHSPRAGDALESVSGRGPL